MTDVAPPAAPSQPPAATPQPPLEHRYWVRAQLWCIVEIPLLLLLAAGFASQTGTSYSYTAPPSDQFGGSAPFSTPDPPLYLTAYLWIATIAVLAVAALLGYAFARQRFARLRLLILGNVVAAVVAFVGVLGYALLRSIWQWTMSGSGSFSVSPTATGIISTIIASIAIAAFTAALPSILALALRRHGPTPQAV